MQQNRAKQDMIDMGKRLSALLLIICMLMTNWNASFLEAFAAATNSNTLEDDTMIVTLAKGSASSTDRVPLTQEGITVANWGYSTDIRYLNITVPRYNTDFTVTIDLAVSMAVYGSTYPTPNGTSVAATENDYDTVTTDPEIQQQLKDELSSKYSGSKSVDLTYTILGSENEITISVPIFYNPILWDKQTDSSITTEGETAVTVTITRDDGTLTKKINGVTAAGYYGGGTNNRAIRLHLSSANRYIYPNENNTISSVIIDYAYLTTYIQAHDVKAYWKEATLTITPKVYKDSSLENDITSISTNVPEWTADISQAEQNEDGSSKYPQASNITTDSNGVTTYTFNDWFGDMNCRFARPTYSFKYGAYEDGNVIVFEYHLTVTSYTGKTIVYDNTTTSTLTYHDVTTLDVSTADENWSVWAPHNDDGIIDYLGAFIVQNQGPKTAPLKIEMEFDTDSVGIQRVSAVRIPVPKLTAQSLAIECTITKADESKEDQTVTVNLENVTTGSDRAGCLFSVQDLPEGYKEGWYFKSITYKLDNIPAAATLYNTSARRSPDHGGNIWGTIDGSDASKNKVTNKITITALDTKGDPLTATDGTQTIWTTSYTIIATENDLKSAAYIDQEVYLKGADDSDSKNSSITVVAGSTATITASLTHPNYPYTGSGVTRKPVVFFLAPQGVSLVRAEVTSEGDKSFGEYETTVLSNGTTVYKLPLTEPFGGWELNANSLKIADVNIELTISTQANMAATVMSIQQCIYVADEGLACGLGGSYAQDAHTDTNNLLGLGNKASIGGTRSSNTITIEAAKNILAITNDAKLDSEPMSAYHSNANDPIVLDSEARSVDYRLRIQNRSAVVIEATDFYYYIPIPKEGDTFIGLIDTAPTYSMALTDAAELTGINPQIYDVRYAMDATYDNYDNGKANFDDEGFVTYYTAAEIVADSTLSWAKVNMIKIVARSSIPAGTDDYILLRMGLDVGGYSDFIVNHVGQTITWKGKGIQIQDNVRGEHTTSSIAVRLKYADGTSVTLTAQKDSDGILNLTSVTLPDFVPNQTLTITKVETENVSLVDEITNDNRNDWPSITADSTFAILAANSDAVSATWNALKEGANQGGTLKWVSGTNPLRLKLDNANNLTDPITPRIVRVTLSNADNTVEYVVTVNIKVIKTNVTLLPEISAAVGKHYDLLGDSWTSASSLTIASNSAFAAQFVIATPTQQGDLTLNGAIVGWTSGFPVGTTITMVFREDVNSLPYFYYYKVEGSERQNNISVSQFTSMIDGTTMANITAKGGIFLFNVDFNGASDTTTGSETLSFTAYDTTGTIAVIIQKARHYELTIQAPVNMVDSAKLTVTIPMPTGSTDDANQHQRLGLVVSLNGSVTFPDGSVINYQGSAYTLSDGKFVIPIGSITDTTSCVMELSTSYESLPVGDYIIVTELWLSATANGAKPMGGKSVAESSHNITVEEKGSFALNVTGNTMLLRQEKDMKLTVNINYNDAAKQGSSYTPLVTFSVQEKSGTSYLVDSSLLQSVTIGNGKVLNPTTNGIINTPGFIGGEDSNSEAVTVTLKSYLKSGSYRILFRLTGNGCDPLEVSYNFIVLDE